MTPPVQPTADGQAVPVNREQPARFLTIRQLAAATTLSVSTLLRFRKRGVIAAIQPGGARHRMFFAMDAVEQALRTANTTDNANATSNQPSVGAGARVSPKPDATGEGAAKPKPRARWRKNI